MPLDNTDSARSGQALSHAICTDFSDLLGNCSGQNNAGDTPVTVPNNSGRNIFPLDATNLNLISAGASLHWLVPFQKRPIADEWSAAPVETESSLRAHYRENANIGIRLGEPSKVGGDYLHLIDLDIRDPSKAAEAWGALLAMLPEAEGLPSVISGSGGESRHLYFLTTKPFRKKKIAKSTGFSMVFDKALNREVKKYDWEIDLMGTGSQAVIPPSIHPDTGLPYRWERPLDLVLPFLMRVEADQMARFGARQDTGSDDSEDDDDLLAIVAGAPLDLTPAQVREIIAGLPAEWVEDRDNWLTVGAALHHQFEGSREGFDIWCEWSKASLKFDLKDAKRVWKSFKGSKNPVRMATLIKATRREWHGKLEFDEAKRLLNSDMNILTILRNDPMIAGKFNFNEFTGNVELSDKLSILDQVIESERLSDLHIVAIKTWLSRQRKNGGWGLTAGKDRVGDQLVLAANDHSYHPIRDALEQLHHDGKHRVETFFIDYLGCADDDYHRETARLFLLAAVARVYEPGHKFDFVPIIEGAQGARKSTFVKQLAMGWGGDPDIDWADGKSIIEQTGNIWIVEMGELASMYKAEFNAFKNAISKQTDTARLAYARFSGAVKRQFVVIGTTNDQEYLSDPTGNRRFWPIDARRAGTIDTDRLEREVPQIWAEAVAIYRAMRANQPHGDLPLYLRGEAAQTALRLQGSRMKESPVDMMAGRIGAWLETPAVPGDGFDGQAVLRKEVCTQMIWQEMERREGTPDRQTASLIGSALARLPGWEKEERRNHPVYGRQQFYRRVDD